MKNKRDSLQIKLTVVIKVINALNQCFDSINFINCRELVRNFQLLETSLELFPFICRAPESRL
jgi:hypothetical protein